MSHPHRLSRYILVGAHRNLRQYAFQSLVDLSRPAVVIHLRLNPSYHYPRLSPETFCGRFDFSARIRVKISEDLATEIALESEEAIANEGVIRALYKALAEADAQNLVSKLIVPDLDYWFHGPPRQDHMMRLLTGVTSCESFPFLPVRFFAYNNKVFVEGKHPTRRNLFWVQIWTLKDGLITQLREYFNTGVLVTDLKENLPTGSLVESYPCNTVWQSQLWKSKEGKSIPGFVLAI